MIPNAINSMEIELKCDISIILEVNRWFMCSWKVKLEKSLSWKDFSSGAIGLSNYINIFPTANGLSYYTQIF